MDVATDPNRPGAWTGSAIQNDLRGVDGLSVLVTGAAGRIGSAVCERLSTDGARVVALIRPDEDEPQTVNGDPAAAEVMVGDTRSESDVLAALQGVRAVVHLAALPSPQAGSPIEVFSDNVLSTFVVLQQAAERGIGRAVLASSINANGLPYNSHPVLPAYYPLDEELPIDLDDAYSLSKQTDEHTARMVTRHWGITTVALRFPLTAVREVLLEHSEEDPGSQSGIREGWSYLDVRDATVAVELGLSRPLTGAHQILVAADHVRVPYLTEALLDHYASGVPRNRRFVGGQVPMDLTRARSLLGFRAEYGLGLEHGDLPAD